MKRQLILLAGLVFMMVSQAAAVTKTELFLDAGGGVTATIDVDSSGLVNCSGSCATLVFPAFLAPHTTLLVTGTLGQFSIDATGVGGVDAISPTLQNLNQIETSSSGAGTLFAEFTDTDYCMGGGGCFGSQFVLSASTVNNTAIATSTTDFAAFADSGNGIPAGTPIGSFAGLTGLSDAAAGIFANPVGSSGSLSTATNMTFKGAGTIQANFQISTITSVPEPATLLLLGTFVGLAGLKLRRKTQSV